MEITRLFDILDYCKEKYNKQDAIGAKENGKWVTYSTQQVIDNSNQLALGLLELGAQPGDMVALIANNRPEWLFADYAMQLTGVINVPIYPTISENDLKFIFNDAGIKYVFVSSNDLYKKVKGILNDTPTVKEIITFNKIEGAKHWSELLEAGKKSTKQSQLDQIKASVKPNDLATILYTSGTTGNPKGVMLSHDNIVSQIHAVKSRMPVDSRHKALSFLPLNHVYERMLGYNYMALGVSIYFAESLDTISDNLKEIKPEIFTTVPRLLEKVYDRIVAKGNEQKGIKKKLFFWALELGLQYKDEGENSAWYMFKLGIARKLIFSKWQEALGGRVIAAVSGGAALQERLARVFWAANIPVLQGYGLTETSPVAAVNYLGKGNAKFGTVGTVIDKVQVKIAADGEILVKGPNIMLGYYKQPEKTAEVLIDGWFHTGDIGVMQDGKYLKITDRKKEIFKTSGGKYIAPQMIENKLKESPFVEQVMVVGENQKYAGAFIVPGFAALKDWCQQNGVDYKSNEDVVKNEKVIALIKSEVEKTNKTLAQYETIKKIELMPREWSIDKGEMTPKLSLKRKVIFEANKAALDKMFPTGN